MANDIVNYQSVIADIKGIISSGREVAYNAANKRHLSKNLCVTIYAM